MSDTTLLALFAEIDPAADAIEKLHEMGVTDDRINIISGVPVAGFAFGIFLNFGTPNLYRIQVGGQYSMPVPPGLIVAFEMTMLFALLATFLGVFLDSYFPNYRPLEYVTEVSDGKIGVFFKCAQDEQNKFMDALGKMGAESIKPVEAQQL